MQQRVKYSSWLLFEGLASCAILKQEEQSFRINLKKHNIVEGIW